MLGGKVVEGTYYYYQSGSRVCKHREADEGILTSPGIIKVALFAFQITFK